MFSFGAANNPAPAPGGGGFGAPAPTGGSTAATPGAAAAATAGAPSISIGSSSNSATPAPSIFSAPGAAPAAAAGQNPAPASGSGLGGGFGGAAPPVSSAGGGGGPAPATGASGWGFGSTPTAGAPSSTTAAPAAPAAAGPFGGTTFTSTTTTNNQPAAAPTAAGGGGGGGGLSLTVPPTPSNNAPATGLFASTTPAAAPGTANSEPSLVEVLSFDETFPGHVVWQKIRSLSQRALRGESFAGQELVELLSNTAVNDNNKSLGSLLLKSHEVWKNNRTVNNHVRQQMAQQREVRLRGKPATLNETMIREIIQVADELLLTETEALSLYAKARENPASHADVCEFARHVYFEERSQYLKTLLFLLQNRLRAADGSLYLQATDALLQNGLVPNLLKHIQEYSKRIHFLGAQINDMEKSGYATTSLSVISIPSSSSTSIADRRKEIASAHWKFGIHERQRAAECLFFVSYNTQMEVSEIASLVDAAQFLTNSSQDWPGMPILHPVDDAPSAYDENDRAAVHSHVFPPFASTLRREKDPLQWQKDLVARCVASGQVALLRCVSTLVLTGIASMDTRNVLLDRQTHASNASGAGNSLIPLDPTASLNHLNTLRSKLDPQEESKWQRTDVFGLFVGAFGLLLKEAPGAFLSPRSGSTAPSNLSWSPGEIRRRLRENLEFPAVWNSFTFGRLALLPALAVPSIDRTFQNCKIEEFAWDVLAGFMAQYFEIVAASPPTSRQRWLEEAQEDLRLQQQSRDQYREFQQWSGITAAQNQDVPSSVDVLERPDCMDDIVALCVEVGLRGPSIAFWDTKTDLMLTDPVCQMERITNSDKSLRSSFFALLSMLATAEDPEKAGEFEGASVLHSWLSNKAESPDGPIRLRYDEILGIIRYYTRVLIGKGIFRSGGQTSSSSSRQPTSYYYFDDDDQSVSTSQVSKKSSTSSTQNSLGEEGTRLLVACLELFTSIASRCADARTYLRGFYLEVESNTEGMVGRDTTLMVLFTLAATPVSPEIRGHIFSAIAVILQDCSEDEALNAWDIVESSGFLPIFKLQQFPTAIGENEAPGIGFPPSSTAKISEKQAATWIPPNQSYSLIYEMEYVESAIGRYPSTIGFLRLLTSLVVNGGCPSSLGQNWRARTGCGPYIEYAMGFVLPRVAGTFGALSALPFRSTVDKHNLCDAALELIKVAASRYVIPHTFVNNEDKMLTDSLTSLKKGAMTTLGVKSLVDSVVVTPKKSDFRSFLNDMKPGSTLPGPFQTTPQPLPKSVGFTILADALRNDRSSLFVTLAAVLANDEPGGCITEVDDLQLSLSLFFNLRPSFETSKREKPLQRQSKLSKLLVGLEHEQNSGYSQSKSYQESFLANALQIVCIVASREDAFQSALVSAGLDRMVPTLRFSTQHSSPLVWSLNLSRTHQKLESSGIIGSLPYLIGSFVENVEVPLVSTVVLHLVKDSTDVARLKDSFSLAFMELISHGAVRSPTSRDFADLLSFMLIALLKELQTDRSTPLVEILMCQGTVESLSYAASNPDMIISETSAKLGALCYETLFFLNRKLEMPNFLSDFFKMSVSTLLYYTGGAAEGQYPKDVLISMAFALKGVSDQLLHDSMNSGPQFFLGARSMNEKLKLLCEEGRLVQLFQILPSDKTGYASVLSEALQVTLGAILCTTSRTSPRFEMIHLISTLLDKLSSDFDNATLRNVTLALYMSVEYADLPPVPAFDLAANICTAITRLPASKDILVATLIIALRRLDPAVVDGEADKLLEEVSETLVRMSCQVSDTFPPISSSEAKIARSALKLLFKLSEGPTVHRVLLNAVPYGRKSTPLDEMISLVARLDSDICSLLSLVGTLSIGSDRLVGAGVLVALERGWARYLQHVASLQNQNFSAPFIGTPSFLLDHLRLMNCVLLSLPESRLPDTSEHVNRILKMYYSVVSHMLSTFPSDGSTLAEYLRCLSIVQKASQRLSLGPSHGTELFVPEIPPFIFRLLENPLPRDCLGPVPKILMQQNTRDPSGLTHTDDNIISWWDELKPQLQNMQTDDLCTIGKQAAEMMLCGLYVIKHSEMASRVDSASLGRGLVACSDSIVFVDQCLITCTSPETMESLHSFRERLVIVALELLHLGVVVAQKLRQTYSALAVVKSPHDTRSTLTAAIDRVQFGRLKYSSRGNVDVPTQKLLSTLNAKLRECLAFR